LYRAVDSEGNTIDFRLSPNRDLTAEDDDLVLKVSPAKQCRPLVPHSFTLPECTQRICDRSRSSPNASPATDTRSFSPSSAARTHPGTTRRSPHRGQLRHAQASQGAHLAGTTARYNIHYTPTYSSWLNQVERWFALISQRAIRRRLLPQRAGFGRQDRLLCAALQSLASPLRLDCECRFHPGKDHAPLFIYFRDTTLTRLRLRPTSM